MFISPGDETGVSKAPFARSFDSCFAVLQDSGGFVSCCSEFWKCQRGCVTYICPALMTLQRTKLLGPCQEKWPAASYTTRVASDRALLCSFFCAPCFPLRILMAGRTRGFTQTQYWSPFVLSPVADWIILELFMILIQQSFSLSSFLCAKITKT
jgi:hypothetical protein